MFQLTLQLPIWHLLQIRICFGALCFLLLAAIPVENNQDAAELYRLGTMLRT
jgi:hypothetical protein